MVKYYCDGSYSVNENMVGCGIITVHENESFPHFCYESGSHWCNLHEIYAIYYTLLLIEKQQDKDAIIYNDQTELVRALKNKKKTPHWEKRISLLMKKLMELRGKGYQISIKNAQQGRGKYVKRAHTYSRMYLKHPTPHQEMNKTMNKTMKKQIKTHFLYTNKKQETEVQNLRTLAQEIEQIVLKERHKKEQKEQEKKRQLELAKHRYEMRTKQIVSKLSPEKRMEINKKHSSFHELEQFNQEAIRQTTYYEFVKISKRKWGVFNKRKELIYIANHILDVAHTTLKEGLLHHEKIEINQPFLKDYRNFTLSQHAEKQNQEKVNDVSTWLNQENIIAI